MTTQPLDAPLTGDALVAALDDQGYVTGNVWIEPDEMLYGDLDSFLDLLSERLVDSCLGSDITYKAVGAHEGNIVFEVSLDPAFILDDEA